MSKNKKYKLTVTERLQVLASQIGLVLMASAALASSVELSDGREKVVLVQPALAFAPLHDKAANSDTTLRREREEETGSHFISYGTSMRTQSRTGKQ